MIYYIKKTQSKGTTIPLLTVELDGTAEANHYFKLDILYLLVIGQSTKGGNASLNYCQTLTQGFAYGAVGPCGKLYESKEKVTISQNQCEPNHYPRQY